MAKGKKKHRAASAGGGIGVGGIGSEQRVLSIIVTPRTLSCSHETVVRDGDAPVRVEVRLDCPPAEMLQYLGRVVGALAIGVKMMMDPQQVHRAADHFAKVDLRRQPPPTPLNNAIAATVNKHAADWQQSIDQALAKAAEAKPAAGQDAQPGSAGGSRAIDPPPSGAATN